jgi:threonine/homoserine/homoserine lactone efflux protein
MTEILITISLVGLLAGFILSMPIAGPISILITSNALKGKMRYCTLATIGASFADFIYVFIAVFGLTKLYTIYKPVIPYVLVVGAVFLIYLGIKIIKTKIDLEHIEEKSHINEKIKNQRGGFITGFLLNFLNPTLFIGWLTSSFFIISMVSSLGLNTGGLDDMIDQNVQQINHIDGNNTINTSKNSSYFNFDSAYSQAKKELNREKNAKLPSYTPALISVFYALFLSLGSIIWFYYLAYFLVKYRKKINVNVINRIIRTLGVLLCFFGIFLGYTAVKLLLQ